MGRQKKVKPETVIRVETKEGRPQFPGESPVTFVMGEDTMTAEIRTLKDGTTVLQLSVAGLFKSLVFSPVGPGEVIVGVRSIAEGT